MRSATTAVVASLVLASLVGTVNAAVADQFKMVDDEDFSSLTLVADGTFVYKSRGPSCWTWGEYSGHWRRRGDLLELVYHVEYTDSRTEIVAQQEKGDPGRLMAYVIDPEGHPLNDVEVIFGGSTSHRVTDADGLASMDVVDMLATTPGSDGRLTTIDMITLKIPGTMTTLRIDEPQANWFKVVYDTDPAEHEETRTDTYAVEGDDLKFLWPGGASGPRVVLSRVKPE